MSAQYHYFHCGQKWLGYEFDYNRNNACPLCKAQIQPYKKNGEYIEVDGVWGFHDIHYPIPEAMLLGFADAMVNATVQLVDKIADIRGVDIDLYVGDHIESALSAKAKVCHALGDGEDEDDHYRDAVSRSGQELSDALENLTDRLYGIRGLEIDMYAHEELNQATIAYKNRKILEDILAERS